MQNPDGTYVDCDVQYCEHVQPSTRHVWDKGLGGTGTHGITPGDVRDASNVDICTGIVFRRNGTAEI